MTFRRARKAYDEAALYEYAIGALGRRMRSVAELKRLMRQRVATQPDGAQLIERVVARLKEQKYLNDSNFAAAYSSYRKDNEKFGRFRVVSELKAKGVHSDVIEKSVSAAYEGSNEEKLARAFLQRKRLKKPTDQKQTARVFRALVRAGYGSRTAISILKHWEVDDEVLTALEAEAVETPAEPGE
ncbi:MAG: regulatory protein RecX [Candidatus Koribacter versatilis]|uniref:Regulatory protein RecX n=1 Tax=Candidatus Korobacter versatilis TaxID=658062 RepID=A0A932A5S5_9BACT|nr:regulatory protein RecX [Candidatus Koribacter versatilis]